MVKKKQEGITTVRELKNFEVDAKLEKHFWFFCENLSKRSTRHTQTILCTVCAAL